MTEITDAIPTWGVRADLLATSSAVEGEWLQAMADDGVSGNLTADTGKALRTVTGALAAGRQAVSYIGEAVQGDLTDVNVYPEGRTLRAAERIEQAEAKLGEALAKADNAITVARAMLTVEARPKMTPRQEMVARADAQMLMDASDNPGNTLITLAARQDDVGALVNSGWGRDFLTARTGDPDLVEATVKLATEAMLQAAQQAPDPARRAAALAVERLALLEQSRDVLRSAGQGMLADLRGWTSAVASGKVRAA